AVGRGIENGDETRSRQIFHGAAHQERRQSAPTIGAGDEDHADPAETLAVRQDRACRHEPAGGGMCGINASKFDEETPIGGDLIPMRLAHQRTLMVSGPLTLSGLAGTVQCDSARRTTALASPCQITLTWPVVRSIGSPASTRAAMSCSTP